MGGQWFPRQSIQFSEGVMPSGVFEHFSIQYVTSNFKDNPAATETFSSTSLGAEPVGGGTRYTILAVGVSNDTSLPTTLTIDGTSVGSPVVQTNADIRAGIYILDTTGVGSSADIVIGQPANRYTVGFSVFRMVNPSSSTAYDTTTATHSSGVTTLSTNIPSGGAAVACVISYDDLSQTYTWSGLTEAYDTEIRGGALPTQFTSASGGSSGTPHSITATNSRSGPTGQRGICASWGP